MILNCSFSKNNSFKFILESSIYFGDLYKFFSKILNIQIKDILYIIFNNKIIDDSFMNPYSFSQKINIHTKEADVIIVLKNKLLTHDYSQDILNSYIQWSSTKVLNNNINFYDSILITITEAEFYNIVTIINIADIDQDEQENICLCGSELHQSNDIALLPCNHLFHKECIKKHLTEISVKCPNCNYDVRDYS